MKPKHQSLINALAIMSTSPDEWRPAACTGAVEVITAQEQQIEALHAELAKFRKVGCIRESDLIDWQARDEDGRVYLNQLPPPFSDQKVVYVKD